MKVWRRSILHALFTLAVCCGVGGARGDDSAPTTQPTKPTTAKAKRVFDAMCYSKQPDLRPFGLEPLYMAYDGTLNRTTRPEQSNSFPRVDRRNRKTAEYAFRRVARAAAGVEADVPQHLRFYSNYERTPQFLCFDLEADGYKGIDGTADPYVRKDLVNRLSGLLDLARGEQKMCGVDPSPGIGIFGWPPATWGYEHPAEPSRKWRQALAQRDLAPLVKRVDAFFPECFIHSDDFDAWKRVLDEKIHLSRELDPNKPIYVFLAVHYAHFADPAIRWNPLPPELWRRVLTTALEQADGVVLWGGNDMNDPTGLRLQRWDDDATWWKVVRDVLK